MNKLLLSFLFIIYYFLFSVAPTQDERLIRHQINQAAASLKTMQCDFVQTKHMKLLNDKMVSRGKMYYQQSDRLRWEYTAPYTYTFILNGSKVLLKNGRRRDVIDTSQNKMFREIAQIMMNSVVGRCLSDEKDFKATISTTSDEWIATLVPQRKDMLQMFQQIVLHFSRRQAMVSRVELIENEGDKTIIELKNIKTNQSLGSHLFAVEGD